MRRQVPFRNELLEFLTKNGGKLRLFGLYLYFSCSSKPLYLQRPRFSEFRNRAFPAWKSVIFSEFIKLSVRPITDLVQQGRRSGGASGDIARSPATSVHWKRRSFQVKPQLQSCRFSHFAGMPRRLKHHFNIQFLHRRQI